VSDTEPTEHSPLISAADPATAQGAPASRRAVSSSLPTSMIGGEGSDEDEAAVGSAEFGSVLTDMSDLDSLTDPDYTPGRPDISAVFSTVKTRASHTEVLVCGPPGMVRDCTEAATQHAHADCQFRIRTQGFFL
jgi:Ferric reductase NAD binding domain